MGYAGGALQHPTYHSLGNHTECFQVDFDARAISYTQLLDLVWESHDPTRPAYKEQYASLVLAHDEEQLAEAQESAAFLEETLERPVTTRVEMLSHFWVAEDYHQKYVWKHTPEWLKELPLLDDYSLWAVASAMGKPTPHFGGRMGEELGAGSCPL